MQYVYYTQYLTNDWFPFSKFIHIYSCTMFEVYSFFFFPSLWCAVKRLLCWLGSSLASILSISTSSSRSEDWVNPIIFILNLFSRTLVIFELNSVSLICLDAFGFHSPCFLHEIFLLFVRMKTLTRMRTLLIFQCISGILLYTAGGPGYFVPCFHV